MSNLKHQYASMVHSPFLSGHAAKTARTIVLDVDEASLAASSRWDFLLLPADAVVTSVYLASDKLDTDDTPAVTLNVKVEDVDGGNAATLLAASAVGQDGGVAAAGANLPVLTMDKDFYLFVDVQVAPEEAAAGKVRIVVEWFRSRA